MVLTNFYTDYAYTGISYQVYSFNNWLINYNIILN